MPLEFRKIEVEISTDNLASALVDTLRRLAPGTIGSTEEIATVEFKDPLGQGDYDGSFKLALTLRKIKKEGRIPLTHYDKEA